MSDFWRAPHDRHRNSATRHSRRFLRGSRYLRSHVAPSYHGKRQIRDNVVVVVEVTFDRTRYSRVYEFIDSGYSRVNAWRAWRSPQRLKTNGHRSRLMLNTFHVRHGARRCSSAKKGAAGSVRPAGTTTGGETRVRKLCYRSVNASEKVQLPPASNVRLGDSVYTELGVVDPLLAIPRRHSRTCSGSRTNVISSRKSDMSLYPTFIHQRIV